MKFFKFDREMRHDTCLIFAWSYGSIKVWIFFFFWRGGMFFWILWAKTILISWESKSCFFSCFELVELFIKITPQIKNIDCRTYYFHKTCSLINFSFSYNKDFPSPKNKKLLSDLHRGSNFMFYLLPHSY